MIYIEFNFLLYLYYVDRFILFIRPTRTRPPSQFEFTIILSSAKSDTENTLLPISITIKCGGLPETCDWRTPHVIDTFISYHIIALCDTWHAPLSCWFLVSGRIKWSCAADIRQVVGFRCSFDIFRYLRTSFKTAHLICFFVPLTMCTIHLVPQTLKLYLFIIHISNRDRDLNPLFNYLNKQNPLKH